MGRVPPAETVGRVVSRVASFVREDPRLVAAGILAGLAVLLVAVLLFRRLRRPRGVRFLRALAEPDAVTVLMHPNPDPDAMSCALGVARLAERVDTEAAIRYPGEIRHQENRAFRTVLDLDFEPIDAVGDLHESVVLVDHNEPRGFTGSGRVEPYAVVDHHPGDGEGTAFTDVRPDYGACATILAEYCHNLDLHPAEPDENDHADENESVADGVLPSAVATGLLYGIMADTNHLTRGCSPSEFAASAYLYPGIDGNALDRIANPPVDADVLDALARAITERDVRGPFAVSDVGELSNLDAIPQAADELLQLEGITAVVVLGDRDDTIHLSGRSRDDRVHMGDALATAVADIPMADAGGHARMGGGQVSIPHLKGLRPESGMTRRQFKERLFQAMVGTL